MSESWSIENSNSIESLLPNGFDTMWSKSHNFINEKDGYFYLDKLPFEVIEKERNYDVEYRFNLNLFRCDNFINKHDGLHLLFMGCSNTEGVGLNEERIWSKILYNKINESNKTSGFYSLSKSGYGWQQIINNFIVYVSKYGAPDYVFVLLPNLIRFHKWQDRDRSWRFIQKHTWHQDRDPQDPFSPEINEHRSIFPFWVVAWNLFISYCESLGVKIIWSTWDNNEINNIKQSNINNFIEMPDLLSKDLNNFILNNSNGLADEVEARDGHPGYIQNLLWAEEFYKKFESIYDKNN